jgi:hypothetical protein
MRQGVELDEKRKARFLARLEETGNVTLSAAAAKVSRNTLYRHRREDEAFRKRWAEAEELGDGALEDEARVRATQGWLRPIFQGGKLVGHEPVKSDALLITMLKAARPEKYRERTQTELTGALAHHHTGPDMPQRETREEWLERKRREAAAVGAAGGSAA